MAAGRDFCLEDVAVKIICSVENRLFDDNQPNDEFLAASGMKDKIVKVINGKEIYFCKVKGLSPDGFLICDRDGKEQKIICGDVKEV